ncbi:hypothetical protein KBZ20_06275 [Vulcanococcus limneticus Candia 3F8]|uniref:hypothetical protein n=1 Tax=Vulcanococcus limneticus TaxID=2170428 RepID=UPI0012FF7D43|nr:hypothetical protein [Vulcanococcus limneticus]MCP9791467.1 hypothetical protein [Vulcanococcus limneticus MW73D5]MCP9893376.1 hypothetical protein [Vulcanococcus limneticus Candia 3F8]MCP9896744.1 hypothetical protein [Vulcanococcus limneticus Candia 3B3]
MYFGIGWLAPRFKTAASFASRRPQLSGVILLLTIAAGYLSLERISYYRGISAQRADCIANRDRIRHLYVESERLADSAYSLGDSIDSIGIGRVQEIRDKAKENFDLCKSLLENW